MELNKGILYVGNYLHERLTAALQQQEKQYSYLILIEGENQYIIHLTAIRQENSFKSPSLTDESSNCKFLCVQDRNYLKDKKIEIKNDEEIYSVVKKYSIINIMTAGYEETEYDIIGFNYKENTMKLGYLLKRMKQQHSGIWSNYSSLYHRNLKNTTKNKLIACDIIPLIQFYSVAFLSANGCIKNQFKPLKKFGFATSFLINIQNLEENSNKILAKIEKTIQERLKQQNYSKSSMHEYFCNVSFVPKKIFNPHIFLKPTPKDKYQLFLVKGVYQYYHYGDQNFSDIGWGCAYRAFQTLLSWLHIQGYTKPMKNMISITQIQQNIDNYDRSRKLKGKNNWIGATQISWLVPKMTNPEINCKILHLSDGKQILDKCEQLKEHFLNVGCPIMYGGGEYAYSIVGMHYNWKLGECQFLILDPHYTGEDEYSKIIEKKGLAWRKPDQMFKKSIFYNFCMPIIK